VPDSGLPVSVGAYDPLDSSPVRGI
jgi:hypothetical protein